MVKCIQIKICFLSSLGLGSDHDGPLDMTSSSPTGRLDVSGGLGGDGRSDAASPSSNNDAVDVDTIHDDMTGGGLAPDQVIQTFAY